MFPLVSLIDCERRLAALLPHRQQAESRPGGRAQSVQVVGVFGKLLRSDTLFPDRYARAFSAPYTRGQAIAPRRESDRATQSVSMERAVKGALGVLATKRRPQRRRFWMGVLPLFSGGFAIGNEYFVRSESALAKVRTWPELPSGEGSFRPEADIHWVRSPSQAAAAFCLSRAR